MEKSKAKSLQRRIFFVHQGSRSFFDRDIEILKSAAEITTFDNFPSSFQKTLEIFKKLPKCDLVYIWFMGKHAVLPLILAKILKKRVILVAGGWDVANCPEIDYGLMRSSILRPILKKLFYLPDLIFSISNSNHQELLHNVGVNQEKTRMIYLGLDDKRDSLSQKKEKIVITIGEVNQSNLKRKGLENFVRAAGSLPDIPFVLIGQWAEDGAVDFLKNIATSNVLFTGHLSRQELDAWLRKATVYAQLSYHEAFSCAVAEAMLHECVPVVTDRYALPEVVGDAGYLVPFGDLFKTVDAIKKALNDHGTGRRARERILNIFPSEFRRQKMASLIQNFSNA